MYDRRKLFSQSKIILKRVKLMAERVGFEPTIRLLVYTLSKRAPRTLRHDTNIYLTTKLQKLNWIVIRVRSDSNSNLITNCANIYS